MKQHTLLLKYILSAILLFSCSNVFAGSPLWTFTPLTLTAISVPNNGTATVQYQVTNQSSKSHTLSMKPITAVTQLTSGFGVCSNPFMLAGKASCVLSLQINGSALTQPISGGPIVCEHGSSLQCYQPSAVNNLQVTQALPILSATISVSNSPLTLTTNGPTGTLTITNTSSSVTALNITSDFTGTALDGNVTETGNTCSSVPPLASCTLTYTPGSTVVSQTSFPIHGSNTNAITAAIQIVSSVTLTGINPSSGTASGGTGITLTGTALTGASAVTFGGVAATSVNVVNSTTVTAVTPAHAVGIVDVAITTPSGTATLTNGYTYLSTAIGQSAFGGIIACLNGGLNNLIAAVADNSAGIEWGATGTPTNASSTTDGATNTATIVSVLGNNGGVPYAAQLCTDYEVDSQGNTPCESGNTCYNDWFLPAGNNTAASGQLNCLFTNQVAIGGFANSTYWSSTAAGAGFANSTHRSSTLASSTNAWLQNFLNGTQTSTLKSTNTHVRCVRAFTP